MTVETDEQTAGEVERRPAMTGSRPCADYDHDCDDMTLTEISKCQASICPLDDHVGYCVMYRRVNGIGPHA